MLFLTREDIKRVLSVKEAIESVKQAFMIYSEGECDVPLRVNIDVPEFEGQTLYMPAYVEKLNSGGVKIISIFPKNLEKGIASALATMVLVNEETGEVCSIMDGTYLTQLRTGAAQGASIDLLARKDSKVGVLFGTGGQATSQLEAMLTARKLERIYVFDLNKQREEEFARKMQGELASYNAEIIANADVNRVLPTADVITTVTTSKKPVFDGRLIKKGAHVSGVGAYTPEMQELDEYIVTQADKIFVDSRDAVLSEAGDFIIPVKNGTFNPDKINGELGKLALGKISGRENEDEITLFKTVGIAVQDIVTAHRIYKKALEQGIGMEIQL